MPSGTLSLTTCRKNHLFQFLFQVFGLHKIALSVVGSGKTHRRAPSVMDWAPKSPDLNVIEAV